MSVLDRYFRLIVLVLLVASVSLATGWVVRAQGIDRFCEVYKHQLIEEDAALDDPDSLVRRAFPNLDPEIIAAAHARNRERLDALPC